jgi:U3 small nucleolar RNA-associated protein 4
MSAYILVIDLADKPRVLRRFEHHRMQNVVLGERVIKGRSSSHDAEDVEMENATEDTTEKPDNESDADADIDPPKPVIVTVTRMAVSPDGQWLATADDHRRTHVSNLDSISYHCVLPSFPQATHALAFDRAAPSTLVLGLANNTLQVYDVEARTFPAWARALTAALPRRFTHLHDPVLGVAFDFGGARGSALFWGASWLCRVHLGAGVGYGGFDKKRRRGGQRPSAKVPATFRGVEDGRVFQQDNFKLVTHYRPILFADFIAPGELVVVERPLVDVLAKLPPAFFKPKYGAT